MSDNNVQISNATSTVWQIVGRLIAAAVILSITAFFTPGFQISNFWSLAIAAVVLTALDYLIAKSFWKRIRRFYLSSCNPLCYTIFCSRLFNFMAFCNNRSINLRCCRLLYSWN